MGQAIVLDTKVGNYPIIVCRFLALSLLQFPANWDNS